MSLSRSRFFAGLSILATLLVSAGCATPYDYTAYRANMPRSILVLPPMNESVDANASYSYMTTISRPLAERGYYVFPVSVIDQFMKDNGLPTPAEMHGVSLQKIDEIIGPDAVLYITIEEFGQKFVLLSSNTTVKARARLVDVGSGNPIWEGQANYVQGSGGNNNLLSAVVTAAVTQVVDNVADKTHDAARTANYSMINNDKRGLLVGPLHPESGKTQ